MLEIDSREYIRHPSDIPLQYTLIDEPHINTRSANNISLGGLSFITEEDLKVNSWLTITIPVNHDEFEVVGQVRWCKAHNDFLSDPPTQKFFDVGIKFSDTLDVFSIRMVEQICYIEHYKKEILKKEGRKLSNDKAASEWIEKFAPKFPQQF
jgi:hypothetical protein